MTERERLLRKGQIEVRQYGKALVYLYWEPFWDEGPATAFTIDFGQQRWRTTDFATAVMMFEDAERAIVIAEMANALLPPNDRVRIIKPPKF